ncbi:MAG: hypothetical protein LBI82_11540 [Dysgonamonadaceae bacterium]|jgi:hypothetical protein|nr:hypothetical protein [Dysgonamonadaceae bacterium]
MEILNQLSSQKGDKTEDSNKIVAEKCIANPRMLAEIAIGLEDKDKKLQSDCIEVFTMVSEKKPELIVQYADSILPLLSSKETKTRWEAVHTLSYIAEKIPDIIFSILPVLQLLVEKDKSTIVRDYAIDTIANYAKVSAETSEKSYGLLKSALDLWGEKHAKQVFKGFNHVLDNCPDYKVEINLLVQPYLSANKKVVATEVKKIIKRTEK